VTVDGAPRLVIDQLVRPGSTVEVRMSAPRLRPGEGGPRRLTAADVVFCDSQLVVVRKPAGLSTVPWQDDPGPTLDEMVRTWLGAKEKKRGGVAPLGVVHRLDKETTGLLVFTRTWVAKQSLSSQFRFHTVHRRYLAIAHGRVATQTFRSEILDDRGDGYRGSARPGQKGGRVAITHVEALEALDGATLVACRLETGRTHQIRIHLFESGHPIVGEPVYMRGFSGPVIAAPRLMLHAAELGFTHPVSNEPVRFEEPMPEDMAEVLGRLKPRPSHGVARLTSRETTSRRR
jgi:23S rRNA pseudouridine1911/1915/1917 synthase